jgi:hypothetical protein
MTTKQKRTLHRLKAIENKAYAAAVINRGFTTSAEALGTFGEDAVYTAWVAANAAAESFFSTIIR